MKPRNLHIEMQKQLISHIVKKMQPVVVLKNSVNPDLELRILIRSFLYSNLYAKLEEGIRRNLR